jgi:hypothetical protein
VIVIIDMFKGEGINCVRVRQRELKWRERYLIVLKLRKSGFI